MDFFSLIVIIVFFAGVFGLMWFLFVTTSNGNKGIIDYFRNKKQAKFEAETREAILRRDNFICRICKTNTATDIFPISGLVLDYKSLNHIIAVCYSCRSNRIDEYHKEKIKPLKEKVLERDGYACRYCGGVASEVYNSVPYLPRYLDDTETGYPDDFHISMCEQCAIDKATPEQFSEFISTAFEKSGYVVFEIGKSGEQCCDFLCISKTHDGAIVRCKKNEGKLGTEEIRDFYKTMVHENMDRGYFFTNGLFAKDATIWAEENGIAVIDRSKLIVLLSRGIYFINRIRSSG